VSRIPNATRDTFPPELAYIWDRLAVDQTTPGAAGSPANIFLAMGNNPQILRAYLRLANPLWTHCGLDPATRELVILRAAYVRNSAYEWHQHVRIGREAGLSDAQINAVRMYRDSDVLSGREKALLAFVDALNVSNHPGQANWDAVAKHYDAAAMVGLTILIAFYFATASFLGTFEVTPEEPFVGWEV
jgi:alkylhydroperoxidase family enzyme